MARWAVALAVCALLLGVAGCGEAGGVADGAVVTAYVEAPLCSGARGELRSQGGRAGDLRVRAVCLSSPREAEGLSLAVAGANARRATEDSTTVAYLESPDPRAAEFTHRILETAEIPWLSGGSGGATMARLLGLIGSSGPGSLRNELQDALGLGRG